MGGSSDDVNTMEDLESVPFAKQSPPTFESEFYFTDISQKPVRSGSIYFQSDGLENGWQIFLTVFVGLVTLWPFYLAGALVFVLVVFIKRKNKM